MSKTGALKRGVIGHCSSSNAPLVLLLEKEQDEESHARRSLDFDMDAVGYMSSVEPIEIKQPGSYVGLSKNELGRFAVDPSWRRIRLALLYLFWLIWFVLLGAALLIVLLSPKCAPKPQLQWYQKKLCYQVWTRSFQDSDNDGVGDLPGLTQRLKQMAALKSSAVWPVPLLQSKGKSGYDVLDHNAIDPELGTMADFENLIKVAHKHGISFIMDLPLTTVSIDHDWFFKSVSKMPGFEQYFRWTNYPVDNRTYSTTPGHPGFYHHWGNKPNFPLLNYDFEPVRQAMKEVAKFWLNKGVDGFYLGEVQYMSLMSDGTPNWPNIHAYLKDFNEYIRKAAHGREIVTFTSTGPNEPKFGLTVEEFKLEMRLKSDVDYVINNELVFANASCQAPCLHRHLKRVIEHHTKNNLSWPMWEVGHPYVSRIASRLGGRERAEMVLMLLLTLPGSVNVYYGDEIGMVDSSDSSLSPRDRPRTPMQWTEAPLAGFTEAVKSTIPVNPDYKEINAKAMSAAPHSILKLFKRLGALRRTEDALLYGRLSLAPSNDDLLVVHATSSHTTTSYLTVLNFGGSNVYNLFDEPFSMNISPVDDITLVTATTNIYNRNGYQDRRPIDLEKLDLQPNEGVVIRIKRVK